MVDVAPLVCRICRRGVRAVRGSRFWFWWWEMHTIENGRRHVFHFADYFRAYNGFAPTPVSDDTLRQLYDLLKWGPTSMNCQPARFVFLTSQEAKKKLKKLEKKMK